MSDEKAREKLYDLMEDACNGTWDLEAGVLALLKATTEAELEEEEQRQLDKALNRLASVHTTYENIALNLTALADALEISIPVRRRK